MLDIGKGDGPKPRCDFTVSQLSNYIDHERPPTKKRPFNTILEQNYSHTLDLLLPEPAATAFQTAFVSSAASNLIYAKLHMKLYELVSGDFFNTYIRAAGSNILMLSEGRPGIDHIYSLRNGVLRLEIDKPTYERAGLEGKSMFSEGRKHVKARYAIELDLRQPSMVHGKKGFERVVWAFKNVFDQAVAWLFLDLGAEGETMVSGHIKEFGPTLQTSLVDVQSLRGASVARWPDNWSQESYEEAAELLEWIGLAMLVSPRVEAADHPDPYLARYQVPGGDRSVEQQDLVRYRWRGFVHPGFVQKVLLAALRAAGDQWLAMNATAFDASAYTIWVEKGRCATWRYQD